MRPQYSETPNVGVPRAGLRARAIRHILCDVAAPLVITAVRYDGSFLRRWPGEIKLRLPDLVVGAVWAGTRAESADGNWNVPWHTTTYFWPDRWYNVFRYDDPYRGLMGLHCHIAPPPDIEPAHVGFTDLGMGLWVPRGGEPEVRDRPAYERQAEEYGYPPDVRASAEAALDELRALVASAAFPFERTG